MGGVGQPERAAAVRSHEVLLPVRQRARAGLPADARHSGLNDPRVSYWEPAKWVAKLRSLKTDSNEILLKTEMGAGHMGPSGRYSYWEDEAFTLAFMLDAVGAS